MDRFTLSEGRAMVQDESVSPPFALILRRTQAEVRNLSTDNRSTAAFSAKGLADNAPVELAGTARFAPPSAWIDATLLASGLQLPAFSPYAMRSLGYKLDKGTLNLDIRHKVEARKLRSDYKLTLDQLELGEKVESPDAIKGPVKLGLSVLKNRQGRINLDIPVTGDLDDPEFKMGPVIWKAVFGLILKAAVSPLSIIGGALSGGPDLSHITFPPGARSLAPGAESALDIVAATLVDRPQLLVGVRGAVSLPDARAAGERALLRKLRGRGDGGPLAPADEPALLDLYARTFGGPAASAEEAAARLAVSLAPGPADLRALAMARGNAVAAYLQLKGVAPERFFSLEPAVDEKSETPAVTELQLDTK